MRTAALPLVFKNDAVYVSVASFDEVFAHCFVSVRALASGAVGSRKGKFCELPHTLFVSDLWKYKTLLLSVCHRNKYWRIVQTALDRQ